MALAVLAVGAALAYPLLGAAALLDDFVYIALGRHIDNPWALVSQDSLGTYFYRPVVMLIWWLTAAVFGDNAALHYAFNVAVHAANGLLAYTLLRRHRVGFGSAAFAALIFVAHPTAFSASAWLSDRFDLFATTFGLCMLIALERHLEAPRRATLACVILAALAAALSKEIGFALLAAGGLAAIWRAQGHAADARARWIAFATIAACGLAAIALRQFVLRAAPEGMFLAQGLVATLAGGMAKWARELPGFLVALQGNRLAIAAWVIALAALLVLPWLPSVRAALTRGGLARTAGLGLALMALAAAAQSPVTNATPLIPYPFGRFDHAALTGSRFYYVPLAGFALVTGALLEAATRAALPRPARLAGAAILLLALTGLAASSRSIGRDWARHTHDRSEVFVRAAVAAVASIGAKPGCHIYMLETPAGAGFFRDVADTSVKAGLPRGHPALGCFIQTEHAPWNNLVATRGIAPDAYLPLQVIRVGGAPFEPLRVSNLTHYYLAIPAGDAAIDDPRGIFLAYRDGRFEDVTGEVRSRRRAVRFYDARPAH